ncbi:MAG: DUF2804 domain-containing protein [Bacillota bacterium]|jgi:hypothetical protein|nr:DUF2804 domain-containing protein [Bacillota bacterium]HHU43411.1 DUF2804 domain-containing protein [Clostridiales bacterium]
MQNRIEEKTKLLDENGILTNPGYATRHLFEYKREDIKANKFRIKEWDYYYVGNDEYGVCLTISDISYLGLYSVSLLDFRSQRQQTITKIKPFTMGKTGLPSSSLNGDVEYRQKGFFIRFENNGKERRLLCECENFLDGKTLNIDITLTHFPADSMVIATPFADKKTAFYYNEKINCMQASGKAVLGDETYSFDNNNSLGLLDWGRGVWTYKNTWYWGSLSAVLPDGNMFGFNIGYGFGDTSKATENMIFFNGRAHKLSKVTFHIPIKDGKDDYMSPWTFSSDDGRFEMGFQSILNRSDSINLGFLCTIQNQVFGRFSGFVILDDGKKLNIDNLLGFAEKVYNKW